MDSKTIVLSCSNVADTDTDGRKPSKDFSPKGQSPSGRIRRVIIGILPCQNYVSDSGCKYGDECLIRHTEADGQPSKFEET